MAQHNLESIFNPRSIAIAGVSTTTPIGGGRMFLDALLRYGFPGKLYPVNPKGGEVSGLKIYGSLTEIPEPVDYVICCVPAPLVPQIIKDSATKKVKVVSIFTSGFRESGKEEDIKLEAEIYSLAQKAGIRIIGPNCMGVYSPKAGFSFAADFPKETGSVAFIGQSGGNAIHFVRLTGRRGVRFSKVVAYGNACDVDESELLEYLTADPETKLIAAYVEGVKHGHRFRQVLEAAAKAKPVIVLKSGVTKAGVRAAASHSGALSGSDQAWDGLLRQVGAIRVHSLEELMDMAVTFLYLPVPQGRSVGVVGVSGGAAVLATDDFVAAGFTLPSLPPEIQNQIRNLIDTDAGTSLTNPVDLAAQIFSPGFPQVLSILANYDGIDLLVIQLSLGVLLLPPSIGEATVLSYLADSVIRVHKQASKSIALVIHALASGESWQAALDCQQKCYEAGLPVYHSMGSVVKAVDRFLLYHQHHGVKIANQPCQTPFPTGVSLNEP